MKRSPQSHKGENGSVLVVGGSELFHGAPILSGLAAEKSGADLVFLILPKNQQHLARSFSPGLIVDRFSGVFLRPRDVGKILDYARKVDVVLIGNGIGDRPQTKRAIKKILQLTPSKLVIDAQALATFSENSHIPKAKDIVLTPHMGEFQLMTKQSMQNLNIDEKKDELKKYAKLWNATLLLKGHEDLICNPNGEISINTSGDPVLTKGGTGDVLAGYIAGLMAQGMSGFDSAKKASNDLGKVGKYVVKQKGYQVTIHEILEEMI